MLKPVIELAGKKVLVVGLARTGIATALFCAETFAEQDLIVPSPGVPTMMPALAAARAIGIPIWSEIELAWRFLRGRLICITGSNGKTTTTSLVGHILETAGFA